MKRVFIDGSAGTTGLRIHDRISMRKDLEVLTLSEETRKDPAARKNAINASDIVFLCLPDAAAEEAAQWVNNPDTILIDTSTAHRTSPGWTYGFPELTGQHDKVAAASRIANPGCHASGVIALIRPLIETGMLDPEVLLSCFSLTGYSGGGKKMIEAQTEKGWEFIFLGANIDAVTEAKRFGIKEDRAVRYESDGVGTAMNYDVVSEAVEYMRDSKHTARMGPGWKKRIEEHYNKSRK